ncbi:MAG: 2-C-methyl-D-erythritol 4-phosphate cytidylyltransferase [Ignavibacteriae bacterium]|nr:MAG: 2-C-methyl-D-erythritol 4-phosphate cytidylyltransferase [Ignavibacteriota bacterium]
MKVSAIIPAGGIGKRFNSPVPKQYVKVSGKELLTYTLDTFQKCNSVNEIIISANKNYFSLLHEIKEKYNFHKIIKIVEGGKERQDSVYNGLISCSFEKNDLLIVHDAARALLSKNLLNKAINSAKEKGNAVVAIKARDTLVNNNNSSFNYVDRANTYYVQTPQIFTYKILKEAFDKAIAQSFIGTDESMLVKNAGYKINIVEGEFINFKITTPEDLIIFEKLQKNTN